MFHNPGNQIRLKHYTQGLRALIQGKIGVVILAGGSGSRLQCKGPKGMFMIENQISLFELMLKRLTSIDKKIANNVSIGIMTSPENHLETVLYFLKNRNFGFKNVDCFQQNLAVAKNQDGSENRDVLWANGNGDFFTCFQPTLNIWSSRGIKAVHVLGIDNVLAQIGDPVFIGACLTQKSVAGNKVIIKNQCEQIGEVRVENNQFKFCEYSEVTESKHEQTEVVYGNIAQHFFTLDFIKQVTDIKLPKHYALKQHKKSKKWFYKEEVFIFDAFSILKSEEICMLVVENRQFEFAPLKSVSDIPVISQALREYYDTNEMEFIKVKFCALK